METQKLIEPKLKNLSPLIGNTPLLEINLTYKGEPRTIYAKAENLNMTGSIKDRMAFHIIHKAYTLGALKPGDAIFEATSGNTGISFSAIGRALGHKVCIFMPDWLSEERINLIKSLGADIHLVSKEEGGFQGSINKAASKALSQGNAFLPSQFSNSDNVEAHYISTGPEIWWQLRFRSLIPDAFIAGVGTGGTIMGAGIFLKEQNESIKLYPLEPSNSPTLSTGCKVGKHRIQGISDEFVPDILNLSALDEVIDIDDGDAIIMAQKLAAELGIGVGISSGANLLGALKVQNMLGSEKIIVTIFPDDNKKYLSTDLLRNQALKENYLSPDIQLIQYKAFKRVCHTCCDPSLCVEMKFNELPGIYLPHCARRK
ncbi:PLP-dependent cysteine synthase family protein [Bacteroidota bacterium]